MMKKALIAMALAGVAFSAQAGALLQQGFDNVPGLAAQGWVLNNASTPGGSVPGWFQGDQSQFPAQAGNPDSYAAANYNNAAAGGQLDNWLITPAFKSNLDVRVSFWLRAGADAGFSDQVAFGFSNGGTAASAFVLDPVLTVPTDGWVRYTATLAAQGDGSTARFAIRYTGAADAANYVGLDSLLVEVPEPGSALLLGAGLFGMMGLRGLRTRRQRG
jgi:hypothetical protein